MSAAIWPSLKAGEKLHQIQLVEDPDCWVLLENFFLDVLCGYCHTAKKQLMSTLTFTLQRPLCCFLTSLIHKHQDSSAAWVICRKNRESLLWSLFSTNSLPGFHLPWATCIVPNIFSTSDSPSLCLCFSACYLGTYFQLPISLLKELSPTWKQGNAAACCGITVLRFFRLVV